MSLNPESVNYIVLSDQILVKELCRSGQDRDRFKIRKDPTERHVPVALYKFNLYMRDHDSWVKNATELARNWNIIDFCHKRILKLFAIN